MSKTKVTQKKSKIQTPKNEAAEEHKEPVTQKGEAPKETKKFGRQIDPNAEVNPRVDVQLRFTHTFLKGASQEERIRQVADLLASKDESWWLSNSFIKVACQNLREDSERAQTWIKLGMKKPSIKD